MANFEIAYKRTKRFEGGYVNDPKDAGGETYNGISRRANPTWAGWRVVDEMKQKPNFPHNLKERKSILDDLEASLYKASYWDKVWGDKINNQQVANDMFDTAVNMGVGTSIGLSQRQFGLAQTRRMDAQLLDKLNAIR